LEREADQTVIEQYGPSGVVVDQDLEVLQFRGNTSPCLGPMPGAATLNLLKIARGDLQYELRSAVQTR
jgi:two-component system CheB/CheR fusion protein